MTVRTELARTQIEKLVALQRKARVTDTGVGEEGQDEIRQIDDEGKVFAAGGEVTDFGGARLYLARLLQRRAGIRIKERVWKTERRKRRPAYVAEGFALRV